MKKEYTIHINVDIHQEGNTNIAIVKNRIWPSMLSFLQWVTFEKPIPRYVTDGLGITVISNLAIISEGIITDIIEEYLRNNNITTTINLEFATWSKKKDIYNQLFQKKIEDYNYFESVEALFWLRNNIAHGRTHAEISKIEIGTTNKSNIESQNKNYEQVRQYFIQKKIMKPSDTSNNFDFLWKIENAIFLYSEVKKCLQSILSENESLFKEGILSEWGTANNLF